MGAVGKSALLIMKLFTLRQTCIFWAWFLLELKSLYLCLGSMKESLPIPVYRWKHIQYPTSQYLSSLYAWVNERYSGIKQVSIGHQWCSYCAFELGLLSTKWKDCLLCSHKGFLCDSTNPTNNILDVLHIVGIVCYPAVAIMEVISSCSEAVWKGSFLITAEWMENLFPVRVGMW